MLTQLRFIHPQLSNNGYPVDGALVGAASSLWITDESVVQMVHLFVL